MRAKRVRLIGGDDSVVARPNHPLRKTNGTEERLEELKPPTEFDVDDKLRSFCMKFKMFIGQKNIQILIILRNNFKNFYHHIKK